MLVPNLLCEIGFTKEEQETYCYYKNMIGKTVDEPARKYMLGITSFEETVESLNCECINQYTLHLLFLLECTSYLLDNYTLNGIDRNIFVDSMKDIKYKLDECKKVKNVFGTFVVNWYKGFFEMTRFALGRLQYDVTVHVGDSFELDGFAVKEGDFELNCHIPSAGPFTGKKVTDSLKRAYNFFNDRLKDGILPVRCNSWLLFPPYSKVFGEKSNTLDFVRNFKIYSVTEKDEFGDAWRVFNADYDGDVAKLPSETTMQRSFINYIANGGTFGTAKGIILFDGEDVLTRKKRG